MSSVDSVPLGTVLARGLGAIETIRWTLARASDVLELRYGKALVASNRRSGKVPVFGTNGRTGWHDEALFSGPGVVVGRKGAGHLGVEWSDEPFWVIDTAYALRTKLDVDLRYAYYLVRYVGLDHLKHGTSNPSLTREAFGTQLLPIPPRPAQEAIAAILRVLDDKIQSNRRLVTLAPQLIRAHVDASLAACFESVSVATLARFVNGGAFTKGATGTGRMVLRIAELNSGPTASTVYNEITAPDDKTARAGDILMSWSGSLSVYRWIRDEAIINQHIFKVIPSVYPAWLVFDRLDAVMPKFRGIAADKATTMGHIQRGHLESTNVEVPTFAAIKDLEHVLAPVWERLLVAEKEIMRLIHLREVLLPELLSGRICVPVEEAGA